MRDRQINDLHVTRGTPVAPTSRNNRQYNRIVLTPCAIVRPKSASACGVLHKAAAGFSRVSGQPMQVSGDRNANSRNYIHRHCERSEAIHRSVRELTMDCFALLAMTWGNVAHSHARRDNAQTKRNCLISCANRERISRHGPPHCRRNSNLPTSMSGRASVQFLPAWMAYS